MKIKLFLFTTLICVNCLIINAQNASHIDSVMPVRGLAISAPSVNGMDDFVKFIENELSPAHFNLLILRVDWNYDYKTHPELKSGNPLKEADIKRLVDVCLRHGIKIAPQINLLGHQSWAKSTGNLLRVYPQFDETPHVKTEDYTGWPNKDGLYCKSYCPLHPEVHKIVFELVDELTDAFETDMFHAGMDEVFYIGDDKCPRCSGRDKAELFAGEVSAIRNHLAISGKRLMIWGDRLIDGKTTGLGEWEASMNNTHRAIDMLPKDVFICDWHYDRAEPTAVMFALKGFDVATCPWRKPAVALDQVNDMLLMRRHSGNKISQRLRGIIATVWSGTESFLKDYYDPATADKTESDALTVKRLMEEFKKL